MLIGAVMLANFSQYMLVFEANGSLQFSGSTEEWKKERTSHKELHLPDEEPNDEEAVSTEANDLSEAEHGKDLKDYEESVKEVGNASLWLYYFRSLGASNMILLNVLTVAYALGMNFPRKIHFGRQRK